MAKTDPKKKDTKIDTDMGDFGDIDDFGGDFDIPDIEDDRKPQTTSHMAKELSEEAGKGFLDGLVHKTAKQALPDSYSNNYYEAMDYADFAKNTFQDNTYKLKSSLYKLGKEVKKALPFQSSLLNDFLEKHEADNEQYRQESEEALRDTSIQSSLGSIFDRQLEIQKAIEAKHSAEDQVEAKERIATNRMNMEVLSSIDANTANYTAFTLQISKEYYRKSLELQYKSYYLQADMLKTMRDYYKGFSVQFESIQKNTGLPDFVKLKSTERLTEVLRTQAAQSLYSGMFNNSKYVENVKKRMAGLVSEKVSGLTSKIDSLTDMTGMINAATDGTGETTAGFMSKVLSGIAGTTLGEKLSDKISPKIKDKIKDNKYINAGGNYLDTLAISPSSFFGNLKRFSKKKQEEYSDESGPGRFLLSKMFGGLGGLMDVTDPGKMDAEIKKKSILDHNKPAIFDNNVHRSITEVIPMYLAKNLKVNTDLMQMYKLVNETKLTDKKYTASDEMVYNYDSRKLSTLGDYKTHVEEKVLASNTGKNKLMSASNTLTSVAHDELNKQLLNTKDKSEQKVIRKKMTQLKHKDTQSLLNDYLSKASKVDGIDFDYETLVSKALTEEGHSKLQKMAADPKLREILTMIKQNQSATKINSLNERLTDVKRKYPLTAIKEFFIGVSKLAGNKQNYLVTEDELQIFAEGLSTYMNQTSSELNSDDFISGVVYRYFTNEKIKPIKDSLQLLTGDIAKIKNSQDMLRTSALDRLLAIVADSLRRNFEVDPNVFQDLHDLNPQLIGDGKLGITNLIDRRLGKDISNDYVDKEQVREITKQGRAALEEKREQKVTEGISSKLSSMVNVTAERTQEFKTDLMASRGSVTGMIGVIKNHITKNAQDLKGALTPVYNDAKKSLDKMSDAAANLAKNLSEKTQAGMVNGLEESINGVQKAIDTEKAQYNKQVKLLEESKNQFSEYVNKDDAFKSVDKQLKNLTAVHNATIKSLEKIKSVLKTDVDFIKRIDISQVTDDGKEFFTTFKDRMTTTVNEFKQAVDEINAADKLALGPIPVSA